MGVAVGRGLQVREQGTGPGLPTSELGLPLAQKPSWPTLGGARILVLLREFRGHPVATLCWMARMGGGEQLWAVLTCLTPWPSLGRLCASESAR